MTRLLSLLLAATVALMAGCASLPPPQDRTASTALTDTADTRLGHGVAPIVAAHPGLSGIHAMPDAYDAFAARVVLAAVAQKSLDAQYFIWHGDQVGYLLFEALWKAAERGVRVRLLLDDGGTTGIDATLATLDAHPNIEVRLYNPFSHRGSRAVGYLSDFTRLNKRMHNKSFTADNQVSVVGGRNIANEYFGAGDGIGFADIDVIGVGPVVQQVSTEFDLYWHSASAYAAAASSAPRRRTRWRVCRRASQRRMRTRWPSTTSRRCARLRSSPRSRTSGWPWSGSRPRYCTTHRPRRSTAASALTCCCFRR
jgi:cardiolipin synthase C